jgi:small subunit ribosomal protein S1
LIPHSELSWTKWSPKPGDFFNIGDEIDVKVLKIDPKEQRITLSYKRTKPDPWTSVSEKYPIDSVVRGEIVNITDSGAFVELEDGFQGLIPHSELSWTKWSPKPGDFFNIGDEIDVKVLKIDPKEQRITLSYKRTKPDPWEEKYPIDSVVRGQIVGMVPFGAFVELEDGRQGLIPHSELSWTKFQGLIRRSELSWTKRSPKPGDFFDIGDEIDVVVLDIDPKKRQIELSYKRTKPDPWTSVSEKYPIDSVVRGEIVNITDSGAFVELEDGLQGLIRRSELSWTKRSPKPGDFFDIGDEIDVVVLDIDPKKRQIELSYKRTKPNPWEEKYPH